MVRPEREEEVIRSLERAGFYAMTKTGVRGRGQQKGIQVGKIRYDALAKQMLLLVVEGKEVASAVAAIEEGAYTGHPGDGKIFIQEVSRVVTIRTGKGGL
jgi:nitrogen regulatory protein PII 1